jgi:hypothetical protein
MKIKRVLKKKILKIVVVNKNNHLAQKIFQNLKGRKIHESFESKKYIFMCFYLKNFHRYSFFSGLHHDFEISFGLNGYFLFTTTTQASVNVKISKKF